MTIPESYPKYYIHFGGHVEDSYFDDLIITGNISGQVELEDIINIADVNCFFFYSVKLLVYCFLIGL